MESVDVAVLREVLRRLGAALEAHRDELNSLNVYPVPDGDTGTNMLLTQRDVLAELDRLSGDDPAAFADAVGRASLMGARGNSGVILAQVLRGLADRLCDPDGPADGPALAAALRHAADEARRAVARPAEGTVLTVLADAATAGEDAAAAGADLAAVAEAALGAARESLERTREALPELRSAGVVDAGGRGILLLFDALASVLGGHDMTVEVGPPGPVGRAAPEPEQRLEFKFEVMYLLRGGDALVPALSKRLAGFGDSVVVVGGGGLYKVHVHTNEPGLALEAAMEAGRPQDVRIVGLEGQVAERCVAGQARAVRVDEHQVSALVAVAEGEGLIELFRSLGAVVVRGGPGHNPSGRDLLDAVEAAPADAVVVLPNHGNVVPAANHAAAESAKDVRVVPTRSVPQGLSAAAAFHPMEPAGDNAASMEEVAAAVAHGAVTRAVRDASTPAGEVREGDWLGLADGEVSAVGTDPVDVAVAVLRTIRDPGHEILTVIAGWEASDDDVARLEAAVAHTLPGVEVEVHRGGQPVYPLLFGLE